MAKEKIKVKKIKLGKEVIDIVLRHISDGINDVNVQFVREVNSLGGRINDILKVLRVHADQYAELEKEVYRLREELDRVRNDLSEHCWTELMDINTDAGDPNTSRDALGSISMEKIDDPVNHPSHYTDGKYETIDFIEDYGMITHVGTSIKYISRAGKKDEDKYIQDLSKADWYLQRYLKYLETKREPINVADYCKEKKLPLELTKVINCLVIDEYQAAHEILKDYINSLKENN